MIRESGAETQASPSLSHATDSAVEVSVVMPCLNEADTLEACIQKALEAFAAGKIAGEVIVADNGSADGSREIAQRLGARVVPVAEKGYGNALMGGIAAARGKFVLMGDADDSYDFRELPRFVEKLREGCDLVQGCRLPGAGGKVMPGAMPFLHYWWGNPMFTFMARRMFRAPVHDIYCGMRAFTVAHYKTLDLRCTGMEFATEMIIKSSLFGGKIGEVPITLWPDGRKSHSPHLRTFRDGWRTLRLFLLFSPRWLFLVPGVLLILLGLLGYALAMPAFKMFGATLDAHTLLVASMAILVGYQIVVFAICAKTLTISQHMLPMDAVSNRFFKIFNLERALLMGLGAVILGSGLLADAVFQWWRAGFGPLNYAETMRLVIPGVTLNALGVQTIFGSFLVSILGMGKK